MALEVVVSGTSEQIYNLTFPRGVINFIAQDQNLFGRSAFLSGMISLNYLFGRYLSSRLATFRREGALVVVEYGVHQAACWTVWTEADEIRPERRNQWVPLIRHYDIADSRRTQRTRILSQYEDLYHMGRRQIVEDHRHLYYRVDREEFH